MRKNLLLLAFAALFVFFVASRVEILSVDEYYLTHIDDIREDSQVVTLSIRCDTILDNMEKLAPELNDEKYVPRDGVILPETRYRLRPGDTVFDILSRAVRYNKIHMEYQGESKNAYGSAYIQGINHLYEFSCGPLSGWMYKVNGEFPNYGVSKYKLKDKDKIEFVYTCDLGRDVGGSFNSEESL
jgi:hypothetical protein